MSMSTNAKPGWLHRTLGIKVWHVLLALILTPIFVLWMLVVHQQDEIIALSRNEVVTDANGNRTWYGAFVNTDDRVYRDVATTVNFLDANNEVVAQTKAEAAELQAGALLNLQASLPPAAVRLRIYSVQWRNDSTAAMMGPFREPWEFGYLMVGGRSAH
jgi:hypothetical protein